MKQQLRVIAEVAGVSFVAPFPFGSIIGILAGLGFRPHLPSIYVPLIILFSLCAGGFLYGLKRKLPLQPTIVFAGWLAGWLVGWLMYFPIKRLAGPPHTHWSQPMATALQISCILLPALATMWGQRRKMKTQ